MWRDQLAAAKKTYEDALTLIVGFSDLLAEGVPGEFPTSSKTSAFS
jgi:hypothetical protein